MRELGTQDAGWYLGVTRQNIWKWRRQGLLGGFFIGSRWRVSVKELNAFKRQVAVRKSLLRPTFRDFTALVLGRSKKHLASFEKRIGRKLTPEVLAQLLREEGRKEGRQEMYKELRRQRRLKYPRMSEAAKRRFHGIPVMEGRLG